MAQFHCSLPLKGAKNIMMTQPKDDPRTFCQSECECSMFENSLQGSLILISTSSPFANLNAYFISSHHKLWTLDVPLSRESISSWHLFDLNVNI